MESATLSVLSVIHTSANVSPEGGEIVSPSKQRASGGGGGGGVAERRGWNKAGCEAKSD